MKTVHAPRHSHGALAMMLAAIGLQAQAQSLPSPPISPVPVANYEYDAQGNPTKIIQAPGVNGFNFATQSSYDALSRRKDTTDAKSGVTQFGYDGLDRTVQVTDPRNLVTQYPRNGLGDATSLISPDTGTASHTYDAAGNLLTRTDSRGVLATYSYDVLNRLAGIELVSLLSGIEPRPYASGGGCIGSREAHDPISQAQRSCNCKS
jgi:YD repeat-containing protein